MANFRDIYIGFQNKMQPSVKRIYTKACEVLPDSLIMSNKYFEARGYLELSQINDESEEIVGNIQRMLLSRTLKNALRNVPYYKRNLKIDPDIIEPKNALEILREFPFIDKQKITKNPIDFVSKRYASPFLIYTTSGGSTGRGIMLLKRYAEYQAAQAFIEDMWGEFGYARKSKILRMGADGIVPIDKPPCRVDGRRLLVSPRHLSEKWLPEIVAEIDRFEPDFIHSYPSCLEVLASHLRANGRVLGVKSIFLASEEVKKEQLDYFYDTFNAPICFFYGANENVLLGYGCYDGEKVSYHLSPLYGFAENLEDDYGHELVGTGLWNDAMPLIRYRTQDYGKIDPGLERCGECGKLWKTVHHLDGRKQYYLTTKQGTKFPGLSVWVDKFIWDYVSNFQFVQNKPGEIELHITPRQHLTPEIEARILGAQKEKLSDWFEPITLVKENDIPLTVSGKRRLVVVNTGQNNQIAIDQGQGG